jgi:hypothetical protein
MKWWEPDLWLTLLLLWVLQWFLLKWIGKQSKSLEQEISRKARSLRVRSGFNAPRNYYVAVR